MAVLGDMVATLSANVSPWNQNLEKARQSAQRTASDLAGIKRRLQDQFELETISDKNARAIAKMGQQHRDTVRMIQSTFTGMTRDKLLDQATVAFESKMDRMQSSADRVADAMEEIPKTSGRFNAGMTQAAYATDDFLTVLAGGGGLGATIRSTSNNIGTMVTAINPLAGIATTIGLTLASTVIPRLFSTGDAVRRLTQDVETFADVLKREFDNIDVAFDIEDNARQLAKAADSQSLIDGNRNCRAGDGPTRSEDDEVAGSGRAGWRTSHDRSEFGRSDGVDPTAESVRSRGRPNGRRPGESREAAILRSDHRRGW